MDENSLIVSGGDLLGTARAVLGDLLTYKLNDKKIDAEVNRPFLVNDPTGGSFLIGNDGRLYSSGLSSAAGVGSVLGPLLIVGGLGLIGYAIFKAVK